METNIESLSVEALKALAYDEIQKLEIAQRNLQIINKEIERKVALNEPIKLAEAKVE